MATGTHNDARNGRHYALVAVIKWRNTTFLELNLQQLFDPHSHMHMHAHTHTHSNSHPRILSKLASREVMPALFNDNILNLDEDFYGGNYEQSSFMEQTPPFAIKTGVSKL